MPCTVGSLSCERGKSTRAKKCVCCIVSFWHPSWVSLQKDQYKSVRFELCYYPPIQTHSWKLWTVCMLYTTASYWQPSWVSLQKDQYKSLRLVLHSVQKYSESLHKILALSLFGSICYDIYSGFWAIQTVHILVHIYMYFYCKQKPDIHHYSTSDPSLALCGNV